MATETTEEPNTLGQIQINHSVIKSIVRLATLEVSGVCNVGIGFVDHLGGIGEIFSKKESDRGVKVTEDANGNYEIEIRVVMAYGTDLAKTAQDVQMAVRNQVHNMTGNQVAKVDIIIDGVRMREEKRPEAKKPEAWVEAPRSD